MSGLRTPNFGDSQELSERDITVLRHIEGLRLVTSPQLQRLVMTDGSAATRSRRMRAVLLRLTRRGLVHRLERRIGGIRAGSEGMVYRLTSRGAGALAAIDQIPARRVGREPGERFVRHVLAVSELAVRLQEYARLHEAVVEEFTSEPRCWRPFTVGHGARHVVKPDAVVRTADDAYDFAWFVEVDLATEGLTTIGRKCGHYIDYWRSGQEQRRGGVFPRVLWVVPDAARARRIAEAIRRLPPETRPLFAVATSADAPAVLCGAATETPLNTKGGSL